MSDGEWREKTRLEWLKCAKSPLYFISRYVWIENTSVQAWVPFRLWPAQIDVLRAFAQARLHVVLKARQLGSTWLSLAMILWILVFFPNSSAGIFSRREEEAIDLLDKRLKGMYQRLPDWMQARQVETDSKRLWELSTGSWARAFPTSAGDSYTFSVVLIDEADLAPDLGRLLGGVAPTVDAGGRMLLISRVNKDTPQSVFKRIYRAAVRGENSYHATFLPWSARPDRDDIWYRVQQRDSIANHGGIDYLWEQYPTTDRQALAPRQLDKRLPAEWLEQCYVPVLGTLTDDAPAVPGLVVYSPPKPGQQYVIGADPAEGNPTSDDSSAHVLLTSTLEECARLVGKLEPAVFGAHIDAISTYYNDAPVLVERNNHGHTVLLWLADNSHVRRLRGPDKRPGWISSSRSKSLMYDETAEAFRGKATVLHSERTYTQLASIMGATLRAPTGLPDDEATSYALAITAAGSRVHGMMAGKLMA